MPAVCRRRSLVEAVGSYWIAPIVENRISESAYYRTLSAGVSRIMRVGLSDHVHCAAFRKLPRQAEPGKLPAAYRPVLAHIPRSYRVILSRNLANNSCVRNNRHHASRPGFWLPPTRAARVRLLLKDFAKN